MTLELIFERPVDTSEGEGRVCRWKGRARKSRWREECEESQQGRVTREMAR